MKANFQRTLLFFLTLALAASLNSCVDLEFDGPPTTGTELNVEANISIDDLKALYVPGKLTVIEDELFIRGVVVADDRSGNFFRSIIFQDATAGIEILINLTDYYNFYPIGRELAINCQGLVLGEDNGLIQLGGYTYQESGFERLGEIVDFNDRIFRGMIIGTPEPKATTINSLGPDDLNTLVKLEGVEFVFSEVGMTFADAVGLQTLNRNIQDCNGNSIVLRTSGFATFASDTIPAGNGSITGIYSTFGSTQQFYIRELTDLELDNNRCNSGTGNEQLMTIRELRTLFEDGATAAPDDRKISGVVISDADNGNIDGRNLILQDATAGIVVRFQSFHDLALGEEIDVIVSGQELSEFNGLLQVNFIPNELAISKGVGNMPTPRTATVGEVLANSEAWESTLVTIAGATLSGGATFSGGRTVSDATGSIDLFTRSGASFANDLLPAGEVEITAIVSQFTDPQVILRNRDDVVGGSTGGDPELITLAEVRTLFEGGATAAPAAKKVRGIVISDKDNANWAERNLVLQDASGGIVIRFTDGHVFSLGEELEVIISGQELSEFNGLLQVNGVPNTSALSFGPGTLPTPRQATIQEILDNLEAWESTLIKVVDVTFTEGGTFSGSKMLQDATGSIAAFTRSQATFANDPVPTGSITLTAVVSQFNDPQLTLRNLNDIE